MCITERMAVCITGRNAVALCCSLQHFSILVVWLLAQGRHAIAIANDITYASGAFSPREDAVFRWAVLWVRHACECVCVC